MTSFTMRNYNPAGGETPTEQDMALLEVPVGAVVTITEDITPGYTTTAQMDDFSTEPGHHSTSTLDSYNESNLTSTVTINDGIAVVLTYTNTRKTVNAKIQKKVVGTGGTFTFTALLKDAGVPVSGYTLSASEGIVTDASGQATFTISPGNDKTVDKMLTIPYGSELTVTEADPETPYITTVKVLNGSAVTSRTGTLTPSQTRTTEVRTILFTNTPETKLTVTKSVTGDSGSGLEQPFTFTLKSVEGAAAGATYEWIKTTADSTTTTGTIAVNETFTLAHGDSIVITVPYNKNVVIEETEDSNYTTSWKVNDGQATEGREATVKLKQSATLAYTNAKEQTQPPVAPTGVTNPKKPFVPLLIIGVLLLLFCGGWRTKDRKAATSDECREEQVHRGYGAASEQAHARCCMKMKEPTVPSSRPKEDTWAKGPPGARGDPRGIPRGRGDPEG